MKSFFLFPLTLFLTVTLFISKAQSPDAKNAFTRIDSLRGTLSPLRSCYDINFYHLDVKFDIDKRFITGSNLFKFTATEDFTILQFDLFANLHIEKILYHGKEMKFTREANAVFLSFPSALKKGNRDEFTVFYSGHPTVAIKAPREGGIVFGSDLAGKPFVATSCESTGASIWWPNKDHLSDEVDSMLISIAVPNPLKDVSNGRLRKVTDLKNGYTRYDWFVGNPINNYDVAANIANYTHFSDSYTGEKGKLTLDYWVMPYNLAKGKTDFKKNVGPMLSTYEHWFGPYPFYEDGYKLVEASYPAMEHQSAIAYGAYYVAGKLKNDLFGLPGGESWDFTIIHESAHEWFGNSITAKDLGDLWIHEAFASYAQSLFVEHLYGKQAGQDYISLGRPGISNDATIVAPYQVSQVGSGDMYSKGSVLLNTIRTIINDDKKWLDILRELNREFYHQTVTYDQITGYISDKSGINLKPVFDQYLRYKNLPVLEFAVIDDQLNARWIADAKDFSMPVPIKIRDGKYQIITLSAKFKPVGIDGITKDNLVIDTANYYISVLLD
jgi:aminopeptidase N